MGSSSRRTPPRVFLAGPSPSCQPGSPNDFRAGVPLASRWPDALSPTWPWHPPRRPWADRPQPATRGIAHLAAWPLVPLIRPASGPWRARPLAAVRQRPTLEPGPSNAASAGGLASWSGSQKCLRKRRPARPAEAEQRKSPAGLYLVKRGSILAARAEGKFAWRWPAIMAPAGPPGFRCRFPSACGRRSGLTVRPNPPRSEH